MLSLHYFTLTGCFAVVGLLYALTRDGPSFALTLKKG